MAEEEWRVIPGFPKYEVTDEGDVRNRNTGKKLNETLNKQTGVYSYALRRDDGRHTTRSYQSLIYDAFPELRPVKPEPKEKRKVSKKGDWKVIPEFPRYQLCKDRRVRYTGNRNLIKPKKDVVEYVLLFNNKGRFRKSIDQLMLDVHIPDDDQTLRRTA